MRLPTKQLGKKERRNQNSKRIRGRGCNAMRKAGVPQEEINEYLDESMSGDYDNLLRTAIKWVATE